MDKTKTNSIAGRTTRVSEATEALFALGLRSERHQSVLAHALLGLLDLRPDIPWSDATSPLRGVEQIIEFLAFIYGEHYAPNPHVSIHEGLQILVQMGIALLNPDFPDRHQKSGDPLYQIEPRALVLFQRFGATDWEDRLQEYLRGRKTDLDNTRSEPSAEAFVVYNEKEGGVDSIVDQLHKRGVSTFFWRRDIPAGARWQDFEAQQLREAIAVLVFLGDSGWGPNHLRLTLEAQTLGKRLIPILIGNPVEADFEEVDSLFHLSRYVDLRAVSATTLDFLVKEIRRSDTPGEAKFPDQAESVAEGSDRIIRALIDGNEEQRADALSQVIKLPFSSRSSLGTSLREQIEGPFSSKSERELASSWRDPKKIPSIRSWMLSSLIWADPESINNRACILNHLREEVEPDRNVRFWVLAGLYQRKDVSYVTEAAAACASDSAREVAALARAVGSPDDPNLHSQFRSDLKSPVFDTVWAVLRVLRIVPIPELAGDVCALLDLSAESSAQAYDALYALTHPVMGAEAARIISSRNDVPKLVGRVISIAKDSNENAARNFAVLLAQFDPAAIEAVLQKVAADPKTATPARMLRSFLRSYGARPQSQRTEPPTPGVSAAYQQTYSIYVPDRAPYSQRDTEKPLDDALGVGVHAAHLAQLIAAKETWMPLSIGLFGAWGSGKSHFIDLLDERLRELTKGSGSVFHKQIVQIRFNAWHYLDANLWANLVSEIFDQLFTELDERQDTTVAQVQKLRAELAKQSALAAEAQEALKIAESARVEAENKLRKATQARIVEEEKVGALLDDLKNLVGSDHQLSEQLRSVAASLGFPNLQSSFSELEARADEVRSLAGRLRAVMLAAFTGPGWWTRGILLAVALAVPFIVAWLADHGPELVKGALAGIGRTIAQLVTAITALSAWISAQGKAGGKLVSELESAYGKVKKIRDKRESRPDADEAQKALAAKRQAEEEARHTLRETEEKMKALRAELAELAPGRQLLRFLKERTLAQDYRKHLGLVSLVRRDFQQLSDLLMNAAKENDTSLPQIDRIVLYIDDLDRCRADRVIEVLEAVHLMLAFPLFAVVVAVDPRWLRQSLLDQYPRLLGGGDDNQPLARPKVIGRPATPQDYLEKIFQVPFNLQSMEKQGFDSLVTQLFTISKSSPQGVDRVGPTETELVSTRIEESSSRALKQEERTQPSAAIDAAERSVLLAPKETVHPAAAPILSRTESAAKSSRSETPDPQRLTLTTQEIADIQRFQPLFQTPRAVKRLANTYCLIRVGVEQPGWDEYVGTENSPGIYRVPMLLIAVSASFPSLARAWLLWLVEEPRKEWLLYSRDVDSLTAKYTDTNESPDWDRLARNLDLVNLDGWPAPDATLLEKWVPRVARYSF